ncbi:hypothetical protein P8Q88_08785 [Qipengyuania sp. XHP0207]|uniref:hypothetical protein n=1 Tax=Qipengyuania sp. XHP0207 TaxID=3038078 RepID=UPI00241C7CE9|nr:hypothetical protein [Qipengyuania sp. XHP0207]MDG5748276.1 hypothetical protein [Qipengyuania sp. XHP0207]
MKRLYVAGVLPVVAVLGGCATMAIDKASRQLADMCEERGPDRKILAPTSGSRGGMFGTVYAAGDCVSPEHEGYANAMTIEEYRASLKKKPG